MDTAIRRVKSALRHTASFLLGGFAMLVAYEREREPEPSHARITVNGEPLDVYARNGYDHARRAQRR